MTEWVEIVEEYCEYLKEKEDKEGERLRAKG